VKSSEIPRLERYLKFHLAEILEKLKSNHVTDSGPDSTGNRNGSSSTHVLKECLLRSREEISSALARIPEGTYGVCVGCGNEIELAKLEVVPWAPLCTWCQRESEQHQPENRFTDRIH
jgi:DnaK suppressor protein